MCRTVNSKILKGCVAINDKAVALLVDTIIQAPVRVSRWCVRTQATVLRSHAALRTDPRAEAEAEAASPAPHHSGGEPRTRVPPSGYDANVGADPLPGDAGCGRGPVAPGQGPSKRTAVVMVIVAVGRGCQRDSESSV